MLSALLLCAMVAPSLTKCPPFAEIMPCFCNDENDFVILECQYRTASPIIRSFKALETSGTTVNYIDLKSTGIIELTGQFFGSLTPEAIKIEASKLRTLSEDAFDGQEDSLRALVISKSDFLDFPLEAVAPLTKLNALTVSHSNMDELLSMGSLDSAALLRKLYLNNNYIQRISNETFSNLTSLQMLDLGSNRIQSIEPGSFQQNSAITHLYLQYVYISFSIIIIIL